jgi:hypothetical protein
MHITTVRSPTLAALLSILALVIAQWILFGFNIPGQSDEWIHLARMDYVPFTFAPDLRPLIRLPWAVAYWLTPGSFLGVNLVLAAALFAKGFALYLVLCRLIPEYPALANAAGMLTVVYPADDAAFALYVVGIHVSTACYLVAVYWLMIYRQKPGIWPAVGIWVMLLISLGIVEIAYPLVLLTPGLLALEGQYHTASRPIHLSRRLIWIAVVWYIAPICLLLRALYLALQGADILGYQTVSLAANNSISALFGGLLNAYRWQLWDAWPYTLTLIGPVRFASPHTWMTLGCAAMAGAVIWWQTRAMRALSLRSALWLLAVGIAALALGFVAFLPSAFRESIERTTLFSSIGAVVMITLLVLALTRAFRPIRYGVALVLLILALDFFVLSSFTSRLIPLLMTVIAVGLFVPKRWRYTLVIAGLVGISTAHALNRHEKHIARGLRQERVLQSLTQIVPAAAPDTVFLLFDDPDSNELYNAFWWRNDVVNNAIRYLYADLGLEAYVCIQDKSLLNTWMGECELQPDHFSITYPSNYLDTVDLTYDRVVILRYSPETGFHMLDADELQTGTSYDPFARIDTTASPPPRLRAIYDHPPIDWQAIFKG